MFKKGDRVVLLTDAPDGNSALNAGCTGTVYENQSDSWVAVVWDKYIYGHSHGGGCEYGYGWSVPDVELEYENCDDSWCEYKFELSALFFGGDDKC